MTRSSPRSPFNPEALRAMMPELSVWAMAPLRAPGLALFSMLGPVFDLMDGARETYPSLLLYSLFSGFVAVGYGIGILGRKYLLLGAVVVFQISFSVLNSRVTHAVVPVSTAHLAIDGIVITLQLIVSYTFFLVFMNVTARRYMRVRAEVELAHQIHQVLVPAVERRVGAFEFYGFSHPSGEVGGDLVDVVASDPADSSPGWFGYVADVSGHGVSSGLVMGMFKSALRMRLRQPGGLADLLGDLNSVLLPLKSSSMYVTVVCVRFAGPGCPGCPDSPDGTDALDFAVAGHLPILRLRDGTVDEITTPQVPIGMFESYSFTASHVAARSGDLFVLLTDGLVEVFDKDDREFGLEQVKSLLVRTAGEPLKDIAERLTAAARAHGKQLDDQTLLLIRR